MITLTLNEEIKKGKVYEYKRYIKLFHSVDKAKQFIIPVVQEMKLAKKEKRNPKISIYGVSYDTKSEKSLLLELDAISSIENEHEDY